MCSHQPSLYQPLILQGPLQSRAVSTHRFRAAVLGVSVISEAVAMTTYSQ